MCACVCVCDQCFKGSCWCVGCMLLVHSTRPRKDESSGSCHERTHSQHAFVFLTLALIPQHFHLLLIAVLSFPHQCIICFLSLFLSFVVCLPPPPTSTPRVSFAFSLSFPVSFVVSLPPHIISFVSLFLSFVVVCLPLYCCSPLKKNETETCIRSKCWQCTGYLKNIPCPISGVIFPRLFCS